MLVCNRPSGLRLFLPLDAICRAIVINLRESLGDDHIPPPLQAVDYLLT